VPSPFIQHPPRYFTQPELKAFFDVLEGIRDRTLFALIYHYGLRVGEVAILRRRDIDLDRARILIRRSSRRCRGVRRRPALPRGCHEVTGRLPGRP